MKAKKEVLQLVLENKLQITKPALETLLQTHAPISIIKSIIKNFDTNQLTILPEHITEKTKSTTTSNASVGVTQDFSTTVPMKRVKDVSTFFINRYNYFKKQLQGRLKNTTSVSHLSKLGKDEASIIVLVNNKRETSGGNIILELEDLSGSLRAIVTNKDLVKRSHEIVSDEVIGLTGNVGDDIFFVKDITWPDIPINTELKKVSEEKYAAFLSDTHIGSKKFMKQEFQRFLDWTNGKIGGEDQQQIVEKLEYLLLAGDIVDGIGVYPGQTEELESEDVTEHYEMAAKLFSQLPPRIKIIMCPGNHDFIRTSQPQPPVPRDIAPQLYEMENVTMVGNPAMIRLGDGNDNTLSVLLYHGVSIDSMVSLDPTLKEGYTHPAQVMQSLLKRRHLSPTYDSGVISSGSDNLIIREIPDIFHTGHVHCNDDAVYRGVSLVNSGTWQSQTDFQKLCGHNPTPCLLPIMNLQTRELKLMDFNYMKQ